MSNAEVILQMVINRLARMEQSVRFETGTSNLTTDQHCHDLNDIIGLARCYKKGRVYEAQENRS